MKRTVQVDFSPEDAFGLLKNEEKLKIKSPYNVLDPKNPFSLENYKKTEDLLYALNSIRGFHKKAEKVKTKIQELWIFRDRNKTDYNEFDVPKYFTKVKGGMDIHQERTEIEAKILDNAIHISYNRNSPAFSISGSTQNKEPPELHPSEVEEVLSSLGKLLKENAVTTEEGEILIPAMQCDIYMEYFNNEENLGGIVLTNKKGFETLIVAHSLGEKKNG